MKNVLEFLERTVSKYPERYAVEDENICFTWRELQEYARKIGSFLCKEGKAGSPVAIVAEKVYLHWLRCLELRMRVTFM